MKKFITVFISNRGVGDVIFHYNFIKSIYYYHKKKIFLIAPKTTKANLIYKNNKIFKKIVLLDLKRPKRFEYIYKILKIVNYLSQFNFEIIYYTENHKWHKILFFLLKLFKKFKLIYFPIKNFYIVDHLKYFLHKINIRYIENNDLNIDLNIKKKIKDKLRKFSRPWVFLSIDTAEDQIKIPDKYLNFIINKLKKKYKTIFVNTSYKNKKKIFEIISKKIVPTYNYNISEINYIMNKSKLFIGNDSGPGNLSSLIKHKSIIFLSKNTKGEIIKIKPRGKRMYINIDRIKFKIKEILKFI